MDAAELMRRIIKYGANADEIRDRFSGNTELYAECFFELLREPNIAKLDDAMKTGEYERAFEAAHALKGLSGNLGLKAYCEAVCVLVEALRLKDYKDIGDKYSQVCMQFKVLEALAEQAPRDSKEPQAAGVSEPNEKKDRKKRDIFIPVSVALLLLMATVLVVLFMNLIRSYESNVKAENFDHLAEVNYQLKESIEERIESDWLIAYTIGSSLTERDYVGDEELFNKLKEMRDIWGLSSVILYTEDGRGVNTEGQTEANDLASERVDRARRAGEYMTIMDSSITYTIPLNTSLKYDGFTITAVSVVKSMESLLDNMNVSSFGGSAYIYLTDEGGKVISRLTGNASTPVFNVTALLEGAEAEALTGDRADAQSLLRVSEPVAFKADGKYVLSTPIETRRLPLKIVYFVPENVVEKTRESYAARVTLTSVFVIGLFAVCAIITLVYVNRMRKRQFDSEISAREHMFELLVKNSGTAFGLFDADEGKPLYVSKNLERVVGVPQAALHRDGDGFELLDGNGNETSEFSAVNEALRRWDGKDEFRSGFIRNTAVENPNYFIFQLIPVADESSEYVCMAHDVTLLYEREAETKRALAMAEWASEAKSRFLSNVSHDIRTPMNAIVNMTDFAVEDMANPEKLLKHLKTIRESSDHLLMLINSILDTSRIESGKAIMKSEPFDLLEELRRLKEIAEPLCDAKRQTFITDFSGVRTAMVLGDRLKVSQILLNLISNAVKFTPKNGAVRFTAAEFASIKENHVNIHFTVEDNGMGISKEFLPNIFEPFAREDAKRVKGIEGTGLGLSICHGYVTAMGGDICCVSEEGEGSTFTVELFFEKTDAAPEMHEHAEVPAGMPYNGMRCLLCEDNLTNRRIARTLLERLGFAVELAEDGKSGVTLFTSSSEGYYDVVYMDIQMPVMDGYEAAVAIRKSGHPQAETIPIVAMSAHAFIEDIAKAHIAGIDGYAGKPISTAELYSETQKALNIRRSR